MTFSDRTERKATSKVLVSRTKKEMESREEYQSMLVDYVRVSHIKNEHIYSIPAREVKIGESILTTQGRFLAYRTE